MVSSFCSPSCVKFQIAGFRLKQRESERIGGRSGERERLSCAFVNGAMVFKSISEPVNNIQSKKGAGLGRHEDSQWFLLLKVQHLHSLVAVLWMYICSDREKQWGKSGRSHWSVSRSCLLAAMTFTCTCKEGKRFDGGSLLPSCHRQCALKCIKCFSSYNSIKCMQRAFAVAAFQPEPRQLNRIWKLKWKLNGVLFTEWVFLSFSSVPDSLPEIYK